MNNEQEQAMLDHADWLLSEGWTNLIYYPGHGIRGRPKFLTEDQIELQDGAGNILCPLPPFKVVNFNLQ